MGLLCSRYLAPKKMPVFLLAVCILTTFSCNSGGEKNEKPLARVYNDYLYLSDIKDIFTTVSSPQDSIAFLKNYVNNWVRNRLVLHTAEKNLKPEQKDFEKQLEEYRNSLIIYTYETELVKQKLNVEVTDTAIEKYYNDHKENFLLKDNIVKVTYVKTPKKTTNLARIKSLYKSDDDEDLYKLKELCDREAVNYFLDDVWLVFNDLTKEIPIKTYNQEEFLKNNRFIEMQDSLYNYFLNIRAFKIKESVSPLSMEKEKIRSIIINTQKIELIKKNQDEIYNDAVERNRFEIYIK
ncbi:MAG: hypothetical protein BWY70_00317 [Bacteroidetes bacterium ADurb.Bin408]|nr:MAG: hypothetical protein BWY70_00317 [Bacteroidetes bacterium ADurb.Bin408]